MNSTPLTALATVIDGLQAGSVLLCSQSPATDLQTICKELDCSLELVKSSVGQNLEASRQRYDLVIVADCLEHLDRSQGEKLLGRLRNQHSNHIAVLYRPAEKRPGQAQPDPDSWLPAHFYAFAMRLHKSFDGHENGPLQLYTYDIESYTQKRDWNNSRYWANPENYGRYWW